MKLIYVIIIALLLVSIVAYAHEADEAPLKLPPGIIKQQEYQQHLALGVTFLIALLAGLLTFTSPCSFVLLPIYFSILFREKKKALVAISAFIVGLTLAMSIFGLVAGFIGNYFNNYKLYLASISGIFLSIFGLMMILNKGFSVFTPKITNNKKGILSFILFGFLFGIGWSPCVGPILGSIFFLAANIGTTFKSILLLITYAMGIAIPLLLIAIFTDKTKISNFTDRIKLIKLKILNKQIITNWYNIIGGIIILVIGLVILMNQGTTPVEGFVTSLTGWVMLSFIGLNNKLRDSTLLNNPLTNILGIIIGLAILIFIIYTIIRSLKKIKPKK